MKLRKKVLYHPGDKRHLAGDQGQATPWGISTHRETRQSGSRWNSTTHCPLGGGEGKEAGTAYTPTWATEAAERGMCRN